MRTEDVAIAIFAKAPIEGFAKTRLIPRLGAGGAANLQRRLIERTLRVALDAKIGPVSLWCMPDSGDDSFQVLAAKYPVSLHDQIGIDLGERMDNAFRLLTQTSPVLLIGTDCVLIEPSLLVDCAKLLANGKDAVFLPVEDGGYILVGLHRPAPSLFQDVSWASAQVMAETRKIAESLGLQISEPATLWDIDRPKDYDRAIALGLL